MKVLHIGKYYPPYPGGIEYYSKLMCEGLVSRGVQVDMVVSNNTNEFCKQNENGVIVYRLPRKFVLNSIPVCPSMPFFVKRLVQSNKYDIVHLHFPNPMGELSYFFSKTNAKLVLTYHTDASMRNKLKLLYKPIINRVFNLAKHIIVLVDTIIEKKEVLVRYKSKCEVISTPVNPYFLSDSNIDKVALLREKHGEFILFVGILSKYKGEEYLIDAMTHVDCNLLIIGSGPNLKNAQRKVLNLGLQRKVFFLGNINNKDLKNYYDACKIFCLPSLSEMFPLVLLEALGRGKALVTTELGTGTSYININGKTGYVVPPYSADELRKAINKMLDDDMLRQEMEYNSKQRAINVFSLDKITDSLIKLYQN